MYARTTCDSPGFFCHPELSFGAHNAARRNNGATVNGFFFFFFWNAFRRRTPVTRARPRSYYALSFLRRRNARDVRSRFSDRRPRATRRNNGHGGSRLLDRCTRDTGNAAVTRTWDCDRYTFRMEKQYNAHAVLRRYHYYRYRTCSESDSDEHCETNAFVYGKREIVLPRKLKNRKSVCNQGLANILFSCNVWNVSDVGKTPYR